MSVIVHRLSLFFSHTEISIRQAEIRIGASNGMLSRAIKRGADIQSKWLAEIVKHYPVNVTWLLKGEGSMIDPDRVDHLELFDKSNSKIKPGQLIRDIDELLKKLPEEDRIKSDDVRTQVYALVDHYFEIAQKVNIALKRLKQQ